MFINRRALLCSAAVAALAACSSTSAAASDLQLLANGLVALTPFIPASAASVLQQVQAALTAVQGALASAPTLTTVQQIGSLVSDLLPAIVGLFPGGGTAVTIVDAIAALLPEIESALGGTTLAVKMRAAGAKQMSPADARIFLSMLRRAR